MNKYLILIITFAQISSCSFQSTQYDYVMNMINTNEKSSGPKKNWILKWKDYESDVYAINVQDQIVFANEKVNIFFKDKQIYKVTGLLSNNSVLTIIYDKLGLSYLIDDKIVSYDLCDERELVYSQDGSRSYFQECYNEYSQIIYENKIIMNGENEVIGIINNIHPNYSILRLNLK
tara:strand:+ start:203 stop:730 length:528 start_codon:yes stop_codon:yes gene_type:complete